jgi:hypothetical protein
VVTMLACFVSFAREAVGAGQGTRYSPRPLAWRVVSDNNSGAMRAARRSSRVLVTRGVEINRLNEPAWPMVNRVLTSPYLW